VRDYIEGEITFIFAGIVWRISSSILKGVPRNLITLFTAWVLACGMAAPTLTVPALADEIAKPGDSFFAGTVSELTSTKITVARVVRGQPESRSFAVTTHTKVEGKLANKVRVTVRYITDDDGDTAILIVVRTFLRK
jgi:hypothetical protein